MPLTSIQPDPALSEHAPAVEKRLSDCARDLATDDLEELLGVAGWELMSVTRSVLQADSASIWLSDAERTKLICSHLVPMSELINREQPLDEGLISLVLASEQSMCVNEVYAHVQHSKRIDQELGQITCAMIAVPFYLGGLCRGVMSCVKLKDSPDAPDPEGFSAADLNRVRRLSTSIEHLLNYRILTRILGLEI